VVAPPLELLAQSRMESAYFVVARRGKRLRSLLLSTAVRDFPTLAARAFLLPPNPVIGGGLTMSDHA
jgi:hypothetical protein